jgi:hypothetical protein
MRVGELAQKIHVSRVHAWRLARSRIVPGAKKTKGGQFYFVQSMQLTRWINRMIGGKYRKNEMSRAYQKHYGNDRLKEAKEAKHLIAAFTKALKNSKHLSFDDYDDNDYFYTFHCDIAKLTKLLQELSQWRKSELKSKMRELSRPQILELRKAINKWLAFD